MLDVFMISSNLCLEPTLATSAIIMVLGAIREHSSQPQDRETLNHGRSLSSFWPLHLQQQSPLVSLHMFYNTMYETFHNSILRDRYRGSRLVKVSPDTGGVVAQVVLMFLFSSTDDNKALRLTINRILQQRLKMYPGSTRIDLSSTTLTDMRKQMAENIFSDFCGLRNNRSTVSPRITGGVATSAATSGSGEWPWQASLQQNNIHRCGATLISNTWLVSAAHCFREARNPHIWSVTFGTYLRPQLMVRLVKTIIVHEKYHYPAHEYDIAVLQLAKRVEFTTAVHRVCLPDSSEIFPYDIDAVVTGWGAVSNDGKTPNVLQEATVKLIDSNTCNRKEIYNGAITPDMLCAGYLEGGVDSCQGDSGGPLVTPDSRNMWYLVGIVSWGDECAKPNKPGVYTRVIYFRDWITKHTGL
ncbi:transmembrane protease serine 11E-like isoform X2 [Rhineura floridana]|uniref:transmembrane protease serine 11E-like isoform X2 n=1 Tax=Rhineura floridana TaxID=261503 RepID=UPI002AC849B6|nr:transmembrane protease serine 11E-like isoform X2 [Rhineura floridana]